MYNPLLLLNGEPIKRVKSLKYQGILLSTDLSWSRHVDSVCSRDSGSIIIIGNITMLTVKP